MQQLTLIFQSPPLDLHRGDEPHLLRIKKVALQIEQAGKEAMGARSKQDRHTSKEARWQKSF
jgi:hypothetical protein